MRTAKVEELIGKTIAEITGMAEQSEEIRIVCTDGTKYKFYHYQDCCETVDIQDVAGNVDDLIGSPLTMAEESTNSGSNGECDTYTWTFYKFATVKGFVTVRWYGCSNGYYSESVDFVELDPKDEEE